MRSPRRPSTANLLHSSSPPLARPFTSEVLTRRNTPVRSNSTRSPTAVSGRPPVPRPLLMASLPAPVSTPSSTPVLRSCTVLPTPSRSSTLQFREQSCSIQIMDTTPSLATLSPRSPSAGAESPGLSPPRSELLYLSLLTLTLTGSRDDVASTLARLSRAPVNVSERWQVKTLVWAATSGSLVTGTSSTDCADQPSLNSHATSFMKNVYTVFDFGQNAVGFATLA